MRASTLRGIAACLVLLFVAQASGCETLRKKFIRKRKTTTTKEDMIVSPRDYSAHPFPNAVMYKQYFTYWKSWNQELVTALNDKASNKKVLECIEQAGVNLKKMATYLQDKEAAALSAYIDKTDVLEARIRSMPGLPPAEGNRFRYTAERILSGINREFDPTSMKSHLKPDPA
jgi:hypothetical protein